MIERKEDRRRSVSSHMTLPQNEQRRGDRRASGVPLAWPSTTMPGAIRPGVGEAVPARERRRVPGAGDD